MHNLSLIISLQIGPETWGENEFSLSGVSCKIKCKAAHIMFGLIVDPCFLKMWGN